jgi:hypothetical protein
MPLGEGCVVRSWHRRGRLGPAVAVILLLALVAGCGGSGSPSTGPSGGGDSQGGGGGDTGGGGGDTGGGGGGGGNQGGGGGGGAEELAWVPFGPSDPTIPTPSWPVYRALADGKCGALEDKLGTSDASNLGDLGRAMLAVCRAAVEGRQDQWAVAEAARPNADLSSLADECLAPIVKDLLDRALDWHRRHPGASPRVRFQRLAGETDCGRLENAANSTETSATDDTSGTDSTDSTDSTDPSSTDPTGGTGSSDTVTSETGG